MDECGEQNLVKKTSSDRKIVKNKWKAETTSLLSKLTLEPVWIGFSAALTIYIVAGKNFYLDRACSYDLGYSADVCANRNATIEQNVQEVVSHFSIGTSFVSSAITCMLVLFLGPWSDKSGRRKPLILLPIFMGVVTSIVFIIFVFIPSISSGWIIYSTNIILCLGGHFTVLNMGAFCYLGDLCHRENISATIVMGRNSILIHFSMILGSVLAPVLLFYSSFLGLFTGCLILEIISLILSFYIKDTHNNKCSPSVFDIKLPIQVFKCLFKKRENNRRRNIFLMIMVPFAHSTIYSSEIFINYMYLRNQFQWTEVSYGKYLAMRNIVQCFGLFVTLRIFKNVFKMKDEYIAMMGAASQMLCSLAMMFSTETWMIYMSGIIGMVGGLPMAMQRPVVFKQIMPNEQGKINCVTSIMEVIGTVVMSPIASYMYNKTLKSFPSCFLLLSILAAFVQLASFAFVDRKVKEASTEQENIKM